jgi:tetratricopeptide (TPR) repeat protein
VEAFSTRALLYRNMAIHRWQTLHEDPTEDFEASIGDHTRAIHINNTEFVRWMELSLVLLEFANYRGNEGRLVQKALESITMAVKLRPDLASVRKARGKMLLETEHFQEAAMEFEEVLRLDPGLKTEVESLLQAARAKAGSDF